MHAILNDHADIVKLLLENQAQIDAVDQVIIKGSNLMLWSDCTLHCNCEKKYLTDDSYPERQIYWSINSIRQLGLISYNQVSNINIHQVIYLVNWFNNAWFSIYKSVSQVFCCDRLNYFTSYLFYFHYLERYSG